MTNPSTLLDNIVTSLQSIPELVTLLGDDPTRIYSYKHKFPETVDVRLAIWKMPTPGMMAHFKATRAARWGGIPSRTHDFCLYVRSSSAADLFSIWDLMINGVPTAGDGTPWRYSPLHVNVDMIEAPELRALTLVLSPETLLDYHEITFGLTEKGDY